MTRSRIPTWPAGPGIPLISFGVLRLLIPVILVALGIAWYSFTPAPNAVLFCSILLAGWVIGWVVYRPALPPEAPWPGLAGLGPAGPPRRAPARERRGTAPHHLGDRERPAQPAPGPRPG